jgi:hypothetical protein
LPTYDDLRAEVLAILTRKAAFFKLSADFDLTDFVLEAEEAIKNYCNICEVPFALKFVWANMALDLLRWEIEMAAENSGSGGAASIDGSVSSIQSGDTTVSFSTSDTGSSDSNPKYAHSIKAGVDGIILNYIDQLNKFRRIVW